MVSLGPKGLRVSVVDEPIWKLILTKSVPLFQPPSLVHANLGNKPDSVQLIPKDPTTILLAGST